MWNHAAYNHLSFHFPQGDSHDCGPPCFREHLHTDSNFQYHNQISLASVWVNGQNEASRTIHLSIPGSLLFEWFPRPSLISPRSHSLWTEDYCRDITISEHPRVPYLAKNEWRIPSAQHVLKVMSMEQESMARWCAVILCNSRGLLSPSTKAVSDDSLLPTAYDSLRCFS